MAHGSGSSHLGVDVCLDEEKLKNAPHCPHGPTLLFERFIGDTVETRQKQLYYACSTCRDRKDCNFFQPVGDKVSEEKQKAREENIKVKQPWTSQQVFYNRYSEIVNLQEKDRRFCHQCSLLVLPDETKHHSGHKVLYGLSLAQLQKPSYLLRPLENNKTNAQYLFSDQAVDFLLDTILQLGYKKVLCIGAPRIHEALQQNSFRHLESLLLDIDHRYGQFYPPNQFCRYNMFNHYFLDGAESEAIFNEFITSNHGDDIVMVTDPPFGGLVEVLAAGVKWVMDAWKKKNNKKDTAQLPTMWIFPYFMENRIKSSFADFKMLDYKVAYDNHPLFQGKEKAKKKGSPVRIFTNISPSQFILPTEDGYRFCTPCNRFVSSENRHCKHCEACTSKDGSTYRHCNRCQRCVKPSYTHCEKCEKCELPWHSCDKALQGCHICGGMDHKRRECPQRNRAQQQRFKPSHSKKRKFKGDRPSPKIQKLTGVTDVSSGDMVKSDSKSKHTESTGDDSMKIKRFSVKQSKSMKRRKKLQISKFDTSNRGGHEVNLDRNKDNGQMKKKNRKRKKKKTITSP